MRYGLYLHNVLHSQKDGRFCLEVFGSIHVGHRLCDCHTFGCPAHSLQTYQNGTHAPALVSTLAPNPFMQGMSTWSSITGLLSPMFLWWFLWKYADSWNIHLTYMEGLSRFWEPVRRRIRQNPSWWRFFCYIHELSCCLSCTKRHTHATGSHLWHCICPWWSIYYIRGCAYRSHGHHGCHVPNSK